MFLVSPAVAETKFAIAGPRGEAWSRTAEPWVGVKRRSLRQGGMDGALLL